ncbi:MAG: ABC transporter permease [Dehalococcoidia bacterium]|jgi:lipopolysaccharide transport system permease protein
MNEIWKYRELLKNLTITNLKLRYQNTALGFLWSLLSPLLFAVVLYFVFRYMWGQTPDFPAYLLVGLMTWRFFANGTTSSLYSITGRASLVTKVYIPRELLVLSNIFSNMLSSLLEFIVIIPILFVVLGKLPVTVFLFPLLFLIYFWFVYGISLFLASLYVYLRDLNQIWEVVSSILFFLSPIIYPMVQISDKTLPFYLLNPMTEFIIMFRDVMIYGNTPSLYSLAITVAASAAAFVIGNLVFSKLQRRFAEAI